MYPNGLNNTFIAIATRRTLVFKKIADSCYGIMETKLSVKTHLFISILYPNGLSKTFIAIVTRRALVCKKMADS